MAKLTETDKIRIKNVAKQLGSDKSGTFTGFTSFISGNFTAIIVIASLLNYALYG